MEHSIYYQCASNPGISNSVLEWIAPIFGGVLSCWLAIAYEVRTRIIGLDEDIFIPKLVI